MRDPGIYDQLNRDVKLIISVVVTQYNTQLYCLILYILTSKFRTILAWKVIKRLKIKAFSIENLGVRTVKYSNVRTFELLILMWISATVSVCISTILSSISTLAE